MLALEGVGEGEGCGVHPDEFGLLTGRQTGGYEFADQPVPADELDLLCVQVRCHQPIPVDVPVARTTLRKVRYRDNRSWWEPLADRHC
ncbi:hypothetical protein [Nonomuraea sp. NPDC005650]|uniref:hypothetical protein n=1 Tax=Nonomuraea sp. NPDC005650 TaxID=3157045 RepID=UPI0033A14002